MSSSDVRPNNSAFNVSCGLTVREYMATHIMAGFAADGGNTSTPEENARGAVVMADALIAALNAKPAVRSNVV